MIALSPVSKSEAARYMGVKGAPDENISAILDRCEEEVRKKLRPNYVYREAQVEFTSEGVQLSDMTVPLTGEDIRRHLQGCTRAVVFAATVSGEADKLIRQAEVRNMAEALAMDCLCSAAIEQVCNKAEEEIFSKVSAPYRTWRFSPGYGDLPISVQKPLLTMLNAQRRIGLTVTESCLLIPSKSVTAIIGISEKPLHLNGKSGCDSCNMVDRCLYRHNGGCSKKH